MPKPPPSSQATRHTQADPAQTSTDIVLPSRIKLGYDILMLIAISIDLLLIGLDTILMSNFAGNVSRWLAVESWLSIYQYSIHDPLRTAGGFFTIFLIVELLVRWAISVKNQQYYRWFFFPFIHWYEVLGCFPQLRALRLLRAIVIGRRLYQLGYQVLPQSWLDSGKFYYDLLLEELSDRVILTATDNLRTQLADVHSKDALIQTTINNNRGQIETTLLSMLRQELVPRLQASLATPNRQDGLSQAVGLAVQDALSNTPELRRYLKMIPIAGGLIEAQLLNIGQHVGENVATAVNQQLLNPKALDRLMVNIAQGIAAIDTTNPELETLIASIIDDSLTAFEEQVKIQQWKHQSYLNTQH